MHFFDDSIIFCETSCMHHIIAQHSAVWWWAIKLVWGLVLTVCHSYYIGSMSKSCCRVFSVKKSQKVNPCVKTLGEGLLGRKKRNKTAGGILVCTPTPWLTLLLVLGKSHVKQNSC